MAQTEHPYDYRRRSGWRLTVGHFGFGLPGTPCRRCQMPRPGTGLTWTFQEAHKEHDIWLHLRTIPLCPCCAFQQAAADATFIGLKVAGAPEGPGKGYSDLQLRPAGRRHPCIRCGTPIRAGQRVAAFGYWFRSKRGAGWEPDHQEVTMCLPCARREARARLAFIRRKARSLRHPMPCPGCTARSFALQGQTLDPIPARWRPLAEALDGQACAASGPGGAALFVNGAAPDAWRRLCQAGCCPSGVVRHAIGCCTAHPVKWMRVAIQDGRVAVNLSVAGLAGSTVALRRQAQQGLQDWLCTPPVDAPPGQKASAVEA